MVLWIGGNVTERQMCIKKIREPLMFDMILYWDKYLYSDMSLHTHMWSYQHYFFSDKVLSR